MGKKVDYLKHSVYLVTVLLKVELAQDLTWCTGAVINRIIIR